MSRLRDDYFAMQWLRDRRTEHIREFAGRHYGAGDAKRREKNLIYEAIATLLPNLTIDDLKSKVEPRQSVGPSGLVGEAFKDRLDRRCQEIDIAREVDLMVLDAAFGGIGVGYTGSKASQQCVEMDNEECWLGESFAKAVDLDDVVLNLEARRDEEASYQAHRIRVSRSMAVDLKAFGRDPGETDLQNVMTRQEAADLIAAAPNLQSTDTRYRTVERMGGSDQVRFNNDLVELWLGVIFEGEDIYTFAMPATPTALSNQKWLLKDRYDGPEHGPYVNLRLIEVKNNLIGLSICAAIRDLHEAAMKLGNKTVKAMLRTKRQGVYSRGAEDEALTLAKSPDGEMCPVPDAKAIAHLDLGGVPKDYYAGMEWINGEFNNTAGNLSLIGGLGGLADTATESSILQNGAQLRVGAMRKRVHHAARLMLEKIAWHEWYHPVASLVSAVQTPYGPVPYTVEPYEREGEELESAYEIDIDVAVSAENDPSVRQAQLTRFLGVFGSVFPFVQMGVMSLQGLVSIGRHDFGIRNIDELIPDPQRSMQMLMLTQGPQQGPQAGSAPGIPPGPPAIPPMGSPPPMGAPPGPPLTSRTAVMASARGGV